MTDTDTVNRDMADTPTDTDLETAARVTDEDTTDAGSETVDTGAAEETETFSRSYVERLRDENAKLRVRAQRSDELGHRLHRALVEQTGRLADPADVEFDPEHLDDTEKLTAAIDSLLSAKPHLRSRTPKGDVGQGNRGQAEQPINLLATLKALV